MDEQAQPPIGRGTSWDSERVRALRGWLDQSQTDLADRLGTRQQTVSEWETGSSQPRRMSQRLLHLVAEETGFYEVERGTPATDPADPPTQPQDARDD
ncbi:MAG: helix-turn-helix transcriptional regulator [Chloroflexi bacterium]|nr:helix-turn-helix transcriptional regulator [Chloroflexota bacterium]MDA1145960.1 helix-turn-helix transcriptional regulator [Chloroflexota bacterium]